MYSATADLTVPHARRLSHSYLEAAATTVTAVETPTEEQLTGFHRKARKSL